MGLTGQSTKKSWPEKGEKDEGFAPSRKPAPSRAVLAKRYGQEGCDSNKSSGGNRGGSDKVDLGLKGG